MFSLSYAFLAFFERFRVPEKNSIFCTLKMLYTGFKNQKKDIRKLKHVKIWKMVKLIVVFAEFLHSLIITETEHHFK